MGCKYEYGNIRDYCINHFFVFVSKFNENVKIRENTEISESIDVVSKNLADSKEIIEDALIEIEKQKKLFEQMKQEAEISQQITSMNHKNKVLFHFTHETS